MEQIVDNYKEHPLHKKEGVYDPQCSDCYCERAEVERSFQNDYKPNDV